MTDSEDDDDLPRELKLVQFDSCARVIVPEAYLPIDEAINRLGVQKHPNYWGKSSKFTLLPFSRELGSGELVSHELHLENGEWRSSTSVHSYSEAESVDVSHAHRFFFIVCRNILRAWENGQFAIRLIHPTQGLLPPMPEGSVHLQYHVVFRFGRGHAAAEPAHMRYLIAVIDRKAFTAWLKRGAAGYQGPGESSSSLAKKPLRQTVWEPVIGHIRLKQVKVTRNWLWKTLLAGRDPTVVSEANFQKVVWSNLEDELKCRGRVSDEQRKAMSDIDQETSDLARRGWNGVSKASS